MSIEPELKLNLAHSSCIGGRRARLLKQASGSRPASANSMSKESIFAASKPVIETSKLISGSSAASSPSSATRVERSQPAFAATLLFARAARVQRPSVRTPRLSALVVAADRGMLHIAHDRKLSCQSRRPIGDVQPNCSITFAIRWICFWECVRLLRDVGFRAEYNPASATEANSATRTVSGGDWAAAGARLSKRRRIPYKKRRCSIMGKSGLEEYPLLSTFTPIARHRLYCEIQAATISRNAVLFLRQSLTCRDRRRVLRRWRAIAARCPSR